jgi:hypothetical protein
MNRPGRRRQQPLQLPAHRRSPRGICVLSKLPIMISSGYFSRMRFTSTPAMRSSGSIPRRIRENQRLNRLSVSINTIVPRLSISGMDNGDPSCAGFAAGIAHLHCVLPEPLTYWISVSGSLMARPSLDWRLVGQARWRKLQVNSFKQ